MLTQLINNTMAANLANFFNPVFGFLLSIMSHFLDDSKVIKNPIGNRSRQSGNCNIDIVFLICMCADALREAVNTFTAQIA